MAYYLPASEVVPSDFVSLMLKLGPYKPRQAHRRVVFNCRRVIPRMRPLLVSSPPL